MNNTFQTVELKSQSKPFPPRRPFNPNPNKQLTPVRAKRNQQPVAPKRKFYMGGKTTSIAYVVLYSEPASGLIRYQFLPNEREALARINNFKRTPARIIKQTITKTVQFEILNKKNRPLTLVK